MLQYDVAIVGGGLVGASLVHALAKYNLKVILIDRLDPAELYSPQLDNRGLALSHVSKLYLESIGCWNKIANVAQPIETVHVSVQGKFGFSKISAKILGLSALGYVVSASSLGAALIDNLPKVELKIPSSIERIQFNEQTHLWSIDTHDQKIAARLLVGADGTNSIVRKMLGIHVHDQPETQSALVTNLFCSKKMTVTAYERFTNLGVLALLPFNNDQTKCVWSFDNIHLSQFAACSDQDFIQLVQKYFGFRLGSITNITERKIFPIKHLYAQAISAPGAVLIGNAANTLHPVAAQGFNLGLRDAITLANLIGANAIQQVPMLYADLRKSDQGRTRKFTDKLANAPSIFQQLGILTTQFVPAAKRRIALQGIGSWI